MKYVITGGHDLETGRLELSLYGNDDSIKGCENLK